jgi:hypothetical protein
LSTNGFEPTGKEKDKPGSTPGRLPQLHLMITSRREDSECAAQHQGVSTKVGTFKKSGTNNK